MSQYTFKFIVSNMLAEHSLTLLSFSGQENISALFNFELSLRCDDLALDEDEILNKECRLEIYYQAGTIAPTKPMRVIHGMVNEFEDVEYYPDHTLYRAQMVPKVWQLGLFDTNEVYLNQSISETLTVILEEAGFISSQDFRFTLSRTYRKWPFRLQYKETHLAYLQRIIEREGIYYYFESSNTGEVMVFCDYNQALPPIAPRGNEAGAVNYQTGGALNVNSKANTLNSIICKRQSLPKKVTLRDFNDETPSLDIRGEFLIDPKGMGEINLYGLNIASPEEGQQLAEIHANGYLCRHKSYSGEGDIAVFSAGHTFTIENHPRPAFNQTPFLVENIYHEGANLVEGNSHLSHAEGVQSNYLNSFSALSAALEFAPQRQTVTPEIKGTLNAVIDTEAETDYAELDDSGRYKIKLPFDRKDKDGGKASHWVRMMQPYGGGNEGMHFPLRKGTRVLLGFIGGDPDRPFISGTISDSGDQQSIVTAENQSNNLIKTASGNKIELEDKEGKNRIKLQTGDNSTYMHLGAPNHDGSGYVMVTDGIERRDIRGGQRVTIQTGNTAVGNLSPKTFDQNSVYSTDDIVTYQGKLYQATVAMSKGSLPDNNNWVEYISNKSSLFAFPSTVTATDTLFDIDTDLTKDQEVSGDYIIHRISGTQYSWNEGEVYNFFASAEDGEGVHSANSNNKQYYFGNQWEVNCIRYTYPDPDPALPKDEFLGKRPNELIDAMMEYFVSNINYYNNNNPIIVTSDEQAQVDQDVLGAKAAVDTWTIIDKKQSTIDAFENIEEEEIHTSEEAAEEYFKQLIITHWVNPFNVDEKAKNLTILNEKHVKIQPERFSLKSTMLEKAASIAKKLREDDIHAYLGKNYFLRSGWRDNLSALTTAEDLLTQLKTKTNERIDYTVPIMKIWSRYLSEARVKVGHHDTVTMQKGNIYDFRGYWNYNLGNSYEENQIIQTTTVNIQHIIKLDTDIDEYYKGAWTAFGNKTGIDSVLGLATAGYKVVTGGNPLVAIGTLAAKAVTGAITTALADATRAANCISPTANIGDVIEGPDSFEVKTHVGKVVLDTREAWVEKNIGNSYQFDVGDKIEISHGNTESHRKGDSYEYSYGGKSIVKKWNGIGTLTYESDSEKGVTVEKVYDYDNGGMRSMSRSTSAGSQTLKTMPISELTLDVSQFNSKSTLDLSSNSEIYIQASPMNSITEMKFVAIDLKTVLKAPGAIYTDIVASPTTMELKSDMAGMKAEIANLQMIVKSRAATPVHIESKAQVTIKEEKIAIKKNQIDLGEGVMTLQQRKLKLQQNGLDIS
jgi:type VI secretion system VgrG family protein